MRSLSRKIRDWKSSCRSADIFIVAIERRVAAHRERRALHLIGTAFSALAVYVLAQSGYVLMRQIHPNPSPGGIIWLAVTVMIPDDATGQYAEAFITT
jgi:hypothetical protein